MKILKLALFSAVMLLLFSSCAPKEEGKPFSYDDWAVCGVSPGADRGELEKRFNETSWLTGCGSNPPDGPMNWSEIRADFDFGKVIQGGNWDGTERRLWITVTAPSDLIQLPRGLGLGTKLSELFRSYGLDKSDENGYFYGGDGGYPSAYYGNQALTFQTVQNNWLCELNYVLENGKVISVAFAACNTF